MQRKSDAVVFIGMVYPWGGIRHFALLGCELFRACSSIVDFYYAAITREADKGCWSLVRRVVSEDCIIEEPNFALLVDHIVGLLKDHHHLLVHTGGGWGQTKYFIKALRHLHKSERCRIHLIATTHSYRHDSALRVPMSAFQYVLYRLYYRMIVFQCQYSADRFVGGNHLIKLGKGVVVPLGCEPFDRISNEIPVGIAAKHDLVEVLQDDTLFKFVYLAAFRPGKMHVWLIHALASVIRKHPEVRLLLCGEGNEDVRHAVVTAIEEEKVGKQILLTGQIARHEVPWLLMHSNCAVVPSQAETFGHNFLEPMFAGLPVLGTRVGIGRDIIKDGETGYGFELKAPSSLRTGAEKLLIDVNMTREMGNRAKDLVKNDFTHAAVSRQLVKVYSDILGETK